MEEYIDCPEYIIAFLEYIENELDRVMWNITQEEYNSPFSNTGNEFTCDTFEVHSYYWGDDKKLMNRPNFKWKDVEISWYKYLGRGTNINQDITPEKAIEMLNDCLSAVRHYEKENDKDFY